MNPQRVSVRHRSREMNPTARHALSAHSQMQTEASGKTPFEVKADKSGGSDSPVWHISTIPAIPVRVDKDGCFEFDAITHLSITAEMECVGIGFNASTIRVQSGDQYYMVFRQDVRYIRRVVDKSPI